MLSLPKKASLILTIMKTSIKFCFIIFLHLASAHFCTAMPVSYLKLQLANNAGATDDIMISFNGAATNAYDLNLDATYFQGNGTVNLYSISSDNINLAINALPLPRKSVKIRLGMAVKTDGDYKLNLTHLVNVTQLFDIWLIDAYKKDSLNLRHSASYSFNVIKSDTNSYGSRRFSLVIRQNNDYAVRLLSFNAAKTDSGAQITWSTIYEQSYTNFIVEHRTNNSENFDIIATLLSNGTGNYSALDKKPAVGANEYRLKITDLNGTINYTPIVVLNYDKTSDNKVKSTITIYPNPVSSTLNLKINPVSTAHLTDNNGLFLIKIMATTTGAVIKTATTNQLTWHTEVSGLTTGTYVIDVLNSNDNSLVGKGTFIKL